MKDMKIITYKEMLAIHKTNIESNFNRGLTDELVEQLDEDGLNLLASIVIPFHNEQEHHRCLVLLKLKDQKEPLSALIDIDVKQYEALTNLEEWVNE